MENRVVFEADECAEMREVRRQIAKEVVLELSNKLTDDECVVCAFMLGTRKGKLAEEQVFIDWLFALRWQARERRAKIF